MPTLPTQRTARRHQRGRPRAQDTDNAQYLEQKHDGLRIQAGTKPDYTVAARPGEFPEPGQPTAVAVAAAETETGVFCERKMDTTAAAQSEIFAVALQVHYILKSTAADAPTGSTLNEPESRAFMTGDRPAPARLRHQERQPHRLLPRQGQDWPPRSHPDCRRGLHLEYCSRRPSALLFYTQGRL